MAGILRIFFALIALIVFAGKGQAQPDYAAAHWVPPACNKAYSTGNTRSFCVIHDLEGYYQSGVSYLNSCEIDPATGDYKVGSSVYYVVNGLQNGRTPYATNGSGVVSYHTDNAPTDEAVGSITQCVRESNWAWHARCWNQNMFGTEHEGFVNDPAWYTQGMYQSSAGLQRHLCEKYGISKDRNHIVAHGEGQNASWVSWMSTNWPSIDATCNDHTDPGQYWNWTYFMSLLNADTNLTGIYWDMNGVTNGAGATPSGTWGLSISNWNGVANGTGKPGLWINTANAIFKADTTNAYTVTISGTQSVYSVQVLGGNPTFTGGGLNFTGSGAYYTNYVAAGLTAVFNTPMTGNGQGAPDKWGPGTAVYNSAASVGTSYMTLNEGTIAVGNDAALGTNKFYIGEPTGVNAVTFKSANANARTLANPIRIYASSFTMDTNGDVTFSGPTDLQTTGHTITVNNTNTIFAGAVTNTGGLTKAGLGTLVFSGATANTYSGATTVSAGTLKLNKTTGVNAVAGSGLTINSGATLLLAAANQIADTVPVTLAGGILNTAGLSENAGTLKVAANSRIDLAAGNSVVKFAASSGVAWTSATTLLVSNWNGSLNGGGSDQLFIGTTSAGLNTTQLGQIKFVNPPNFDAGIYTAKILTTGEVVPVAVAPSMATQPLSQSVLAGTNVTFSATMNGTTPIMYQWRWNGANISGATSNKLTLTNISLGQAGSYWLVGTNMAGLAASSVASLSVYVTAAPSFNAPASHTNGQFSFDISGVPGWRYIIEQSPDLLDWNPVLTNFSPFTFTDTNVVHNFSRYYRALYAP